MHVEVTPHVRITDQLGERRLLCPLDLPNPFAQFGGDMGQVERLVDGRLVLAGDEFVPLEKPVFVQLHSPTFGTLAHQRIVFAAPGEVGESERENRIFHDPEVRLYPRGQHDAGFGFAA